MKTIKFHIASIILIFTIVFSFAVPRPKYHGTSILKDLAMPAAFTEWKSEDYTNDLSTSKDDRYNFMSGAFARIYGVRDGRSLLLLIIDAGNFHHPQLCYNGSGYKITELGDTALKTPAKTLTVKTFLAQKDKGENFVVMYWMAINKQKVDWTEQKITQMWYALFNKKQVGLMTRLDIPVIDGKSDEAVQFGQKFIIDLSAAMPAEKQEWMFGK